MKPTVFRGHNKMRIFQEEIFGPVVSVTTFKNEDEALEIANDTIYGRVNQTVGVQFTPLGEHSASF